MNNKDKYWEKNHAIIMEIANEMDVDDWNYYFANKGLSKKR